MARVILSQLTFLLSPKPKPSLPILFYVLFEAEFQQLKKTNTDLPLLSYWIETKWSPDPKQKGPLYRFSLPFSPPVECVCVAN